MFSRIRKRITYANVAMTLALVFAMSGGAYAAKHYLITSTKQISPKVLTALKGKIGTNGVNGKDGAQGPAGEKGPAGTNGTNGKDGTNGTEGQTGAAGPAGATGATGPEGVCSTANCVLPKGVSLKGAWGTAGIPTELPGFGGLAAVYTPISFTIPFAGAPSPHVIAIGGKGTGPGEGCPTTSNATKPEAEPGNLCIFVQSSTNVKTFAPSDPEEGTLFAAGKTGSVLVVIAETAGKGVLAKGSWAVTG
jgi:hypothetical protein